MTDTDHLKEVGMNGVKWAAWFMDRFGSRRDEITEELMIGWFANAIMAGYDEGQRSRVEVDASDVQVRQWAFARVDALEDALILVLPLAKGYASEHDVGSNQRYVEDAVRVLHPGMAIEVEEPRS